MNILYLGSDCLKERIRRQTLGQAWELFTAEDPDHVLDYAGTHTFQAMIIGMCSDGVAIRTAVQNAKSSLDVPVTIGLASQEHAMRIGETSQKGVDIVVSECGNDCLTKLQCDAILRLANGATSECISCGGLSFHTSEDKFSVGGRDIYLPRKKHKLLELLFLKRGRTVTKEMVFNHLYGWEEPPATKTVDVFICQLRRELRRAGLEQDCIQTVWGQGYRLTDIPASENKRAA